MYEHFLYAALAKASKSVKSATGKDHSRQRLEALTRVVEEIVDLEWLVREKNGPRFSSRVFLHASLPHPGH